MKAIKILALSGAIALAGLAGCGSSTTASTETTTAVAEENPLSNKVYVNNSLIVKDPFECTWIAFFDDNTFQVILAKGKQGYGNSYGTYTVDKNAITLNYENETYTGVIMEDKKVVIGSQEFAPGMGGLTPDQKFIDNLKKKIDIVE